LQRILEIQQRTISRRGYWRYNRGQQRTSAAKNTRVTTNDHQQKRILEVQQRTTIKDLSCKRHWRYGKGTSVEGDAGGTTKDNNRGPQLQRILEIRHGPSAEEDTGGTTEDLNCKGFWIYDKGPSAEEDTEGKQRPNKGPQLQRILEIRQRTISRRGYWRYNRGPELQRILDI
jgi:hypothetical protein